MKEPSLDDLRVFLAVASEGSLNAAANHLSASTATLSRRTNQLELQTGRTLFRRHAGGYELTADGASLRERVLVLDAVRADLTDWLAGPASRATVRVSAGTWTCGFLADQFAHLQQSVDDFTLVLVSTEERSSIVHREVDIGLRNARPDEQNVAVRRVAEVCFASYSARSASFDGEDPLRWPWLLVVPECARTPSARWMVQHRLSRAALQVTSSRTLLDLALAGAGVTVLPCFVGDRLPGLRRVGPVIAELTESQWLVMHGDTRHRPAVRSVLERIGTVIEENAGLYRGERRQPG